MGAREDRSSWLAYVDINVRAKNLILHCSSRFNSTYISYIEPFTFTHMWKEYMSDKIAFDIVHKSGIRTKNCKHETRNKGD